MKKPASLILSILLIICLALPAAAQEEAAGNGLAADVCVLFTSDVHCGVDKNFTYAGLAAARESMKDAGYHVLLVDNGDSIQGETMGTLTSGTGTPSPHLNLIQCGTGRTPTITSPSS